MRYSKEERLSRRYCGQVGRKLLCPGRLRHAMLVRLRGDVQDFLAANPQADMAQLTAHFGTPEEFADTVIAAVEPQLLRKRMLKVRLVRVVCIGLIAALLMWMATIFTLRIIAQIQTENVIIIGPPQYTDSLPEPGVRYESPQQTADGAVVGQVEYEDHLSEPGTRYEAPQQTGDNAQSE